MFVQNTETTNGDQKDGVAIQQRRGGRETLVQWSNGDCRWINTDKLKGNLSQVEDRTKDMFNNEQNIEAIEKDMETNNQEETVNRFTWC